MGSIRTFRAAYALQNECINNLKPLRIYFIHRLKLSRNNIGVQFTPIVLSYCKYRISAKAILRVEPGISLNEKISVARALKQRKNTFLCNYWRLGAFLSHMNMWS